jgi:hypothetical protein
MSVPNIGPERPDRYDPDDARKGNPAAVHCDLQLLGEVEAASTRASALSHRFGGVRYALSRPGTIDRQPRDGGESDPQD